MNLDALKSVPHRRYNPLTREWVLVSPHRTERPWQGQVEKPEAAKQLEYDPTCYLCPGNERAGGLRNPKYISTYVFDNDFAALKPDIPSITADVNEKGIVVASAERGLCRVVCFSPRHDLTIAQMPVQAIRPVIDTWADQYQQLGGLPWINHVQIFENRGAIMGCSNPHPHGQIWANQTVPDEPRKEQSSFEDYLRDRGECVLCGYLELESAAGERIVCENDHFVALVPFWAIWPFETLLLSKEHLPDIVLANAKRDALADIMKRLTTRYDNLFQISFPYSMGFHQRPTDGQEHQEWHLHAHYYPPLLRSATVKKFMVGYEMLAEPQRDITPESAAQRLREMPETRI
jgi:UDPglucose--hexose-1-phosphate uridylyltransferase